MSYFPKVMQKVFASTSDFVTYVNDQQTFLTDEGTLASEKLFRKGQKVLLADKQIELLFVNPVSNASSIVTSTGIKLNSQFVIARYPKPTWKIGSGVSSSTTVGNPTSNANYTSTTNSNNLRIEKCTWYLMAETNSDLYIGQSIQVSALNDVKIKLGPENGSFTLTLSGTNYVQNNTFTVPPGQYIITKTATNKYTMIDILALFIKAGGGLVNGVDGIFVDPSTFSSGIVEEFMKALRVPIWVSGNTTWYVRPDGNDNNDGFANTSARAFKTIQAALNNIADNYNLGAYTATVAIAEGTYAKVSLPKFNASTGKIVLSGAGKDKTIVTATNTTVISGLPGSGQYTIQNMTVVLNKDAANTAIAAYGISAVEGCSFTVHTVKVIRNRLETSTGSDSLLAAPYGGRLGIQDNCLLESNVSAGTSGSSIRAMHATLSGIITISDDLVVDGEFTYLASTSELGCIRAQRAVRPYVTGNVTGGRYTATLMGNISTGTGEPDFFPGTTPGVVDSHSMYS